MKGSTWVTVFLIVALGVVGYLWFASTNRDNRIARDLDNDNAQVGEGVDIDNDNDDDRNNNRVGQLSDVAADVRGENAKECNECHKPGSKYSLSNEAKAIEGHPPVSSDDVNNCMKCHKNPNKDYAFRYVLHTAHLGEDDSNFITKYNGRCTTCHRMEENGKIVVAGIKSD
ncbi:MAG: NapC/NirT family cytochrome c [Firmicutes bacterium]|nr:NapC/NirT family cytochrome c [Bacillota bacterium]